MRSSVNSIALQPVSVTPSSPPKKQVVSPNSKDSLYAQMPALRILSSGYDQDMDLEYYKASVFLTSGIHDPSDKENEGYFVNQSSTEQPEKGSRNPSSRKPGILFSKHLDKILGPAKSQKIVQCVQRLGEGLLKCAAEAQKVLVIDQGLTSHLIFKPSGKIYLSLKTLGKGGFKDTYTIALVAFNQMQQQTKQPIYRALSLSRANGDPTQLKDLYEEKALNSYLKEQAKVHDLSHVNVIKSAFLVNLDQVGMIGQVFGEGDLDRWLQQRVFTTAEKSAIIFQASKGVFQLHQVGVVHRDLKPDNILIRKDAEGRLFAKITDFGVASRVEKAHRSSSNLFFDRYLDPQWKLDSNDIENRFAKAIDIYQLGMIICQIYADYCIEEWIKLQNQEMEFFQRPGEVQTTDDLLHEWKMNPDQWSVLQKIDDIAKCEGVRKMVDPNQVQRPVIEEVVTLFS